MNDQSIIKECVEDIVREVLQRTDVPRRRVSFAPSTKASDGIKEKEIEYLLGGLRTTLRASGEEGLITVR